MSDEESKKSRTERLSLHALIRERYAEMSPRERRVADLVLSSPQLMNGFTATEVAQRAEVSKATVTRFVARLGLSGFDEFRRAARTSNLLSAGSPLQLMEHHLASTRGDLQELMDQTLRLDTYNLTQTYAEISIDDVAEVCRLLAGSRHVLFADFRKQYALAFYAATLFRVIRPGVLTLPLLGASAVDGTLDLQADDVVVMFPFRRPERDHDVLSRTVVESGATLVAISDVWPSPTTRRAAIHLRCRTDSAGLFDSFVSPMSLINLLFAATADLLGDSARERLELLEERHHTFQTFVEGRRRSGRGGSRRGGSRGSRT